MSGLTRDLLSQLFNGNPRAVKAFEDQARTVAAVEAQTLTTVAATDALEDATVLTLSPNATLRNERVVARGHGIELVDDGTNVTIRIKSDEAPIVEGGFDVILRAQGITDLLLPIEGTLATRAGTETFANKTLAAPKLSGLTNAANDAAAAGAGVPVGGVYRNGSALQVRVT